MGKGPRSPDTDFLKGTCKSGGQPCPVVGPRREDASSFIRTLTAWLKRSMLLHAQTLLHGTLSARKKGLECFRRFPGEELELNLGQR